MPNTSFSQKFQLLESLTHEFESGKLDLETAIPKFEQAVKLAKELKQQLQSMENQIEEISLDLKTDQKPTPII